MLVLTRFAHGALIRRTLNHGFMTVGIPCLISVTSFPLSSAKIHSHFFRGAPPALRQPYDYHGMPIIASSTPDNRNEHMIKAWQFIIAQVAGTGVEIWLKLVWLENFSAILTWEIKRSFFPFDYKIEWLECRILFFCMDKVHCQHTLKQRQELYKRNLPDLWVNKSSLVLKLI